MKRSQQKANGTLWEYPMYSRLCGAIGMDVDQDGTSEIILATEAGDVHVLDQQGKLKWRFAIGSAVRTICAADINRDFHEKLIVGTQDAGLLLMNDEGQVCWRYQTNRRISNICTADVDNDEKMEIVAGCWDKCVYIIDALGSLKRHFNIGSIVRSVCAEDINNDGVLELIVGCEDGKLNVMDIRGQLLWGYQCGHRILSLVVKDIDYDGSLEIMFGSEDRNLYVLDGRGKLKWKYCSQGRVKNIYVADVDGDGILEIVLVTDRHICILTSDGELREQQLVDSSIENVFMVDVGVEGLVFIACSRENKVICCKLESRKSFFKFAKQDIGEPSLYTEACKAYEARRYLDAIHMFLTLKSQRMDLMWTYEGHGEGLDRVFKICTRDLGSEGGLEIIAACGDGSIHFLNANGELRHKITIARGSRLRSLCPMKGLNGDAELLVGGEDGNIYSLDSNGNMLILFKLGAWIHDLSVFDIDGDGELEVIAALEDATVRTLSLGYRKEKWRYVAEGSVRCVYAADIDRDGETEVIAGSNGNTLFVLDKRGDLKWRYYAGDKIRAICQVDIEKDGNVELIIGSEDKKIHVLDPNGKPRWQYMTEGWVRSICVADIDNDRAVEIVAGGSARAVYILDNEGNLKWEQQIPDEIRTISVADVDNDGDRELLIGSLGGRIFAYKVINQAKVQSYIDECLKRLLYREKIPLVRVPADRDTTLSLAHSRQNLASTIVGYLPQHLQVEITYKVEKFQRDPDAIWGFDRLKEMVFHNHKHAIGVFELANELLMPKLREFPNFLSTEELYCLIHAIWLHDIGHQGTHEIQDPMEIRTNHGVISAQLIGRNCCDYALPQSAAEVVGLLCSYHQHYSPLDHDQMRKLGPKRDLLPLKTRRALPSQIENFIGESDVPEIRIRLLAAILRLLDACDIQRQRCGSKEYKRAKVRSVANRITFEKRQKKVAIDRILNLVRMTGDIPQHDIKEMRGILNDIPEDKRDLDSQFIQLEDMVERMSVSKTVRKDLLGQLLLWFKVTDYIAFLQDAPTHYDLHDFFSRVKIENDAIVFVHELDPPFDRLQQLCSMASRFVVDELKVVQKFLREAGLEINCIVFRDPLGTVSKRLNT